MRKNPRNESPGAGPGIELGNRIPGGLYSDIDAYYSARVARYGATPLGVDWSCQATQSLRFVQLLKICDFSVPLSLNDIGCGYGALAAFLAMRHSETKIDYLGVDLARAMVDRARRRFSAPDRRFVVRTSSPRIADYSVASGVMNVSLGYSRSTWEDFVARILREMKETSRRGFSVNFMTDATPPGKTAVLSADGLYRTSPQRWIRYCERDLGCSVETITGYGMREFTLLVRCNEIAAAQA